jgi:cardiolipin synthase
VDREKALKRVSRERRHPDARTREPKGRRALGTRLRRLIWSWWLWAAIFTVAIAWQNWGLAAGAGAAAVLTYLVSPHKQIPSYGLDHEFPITSDEFLSSIVGATGVPFVAENRVQIFNNGDEFYPAMLEAIEEAKESITIEAYIYWAGHIGRRFAQALAAKARQGIKVKILLDAVGSASIGKEILQTLESGECQIEWYNPIRWHSIRRYNNRTHRKSLIVDGRIAFTGGAGIADHWMGHAEDPEHWRDIQIRIEGPGVMPLQTGFAQNWLETTGELVSGRLYYPAAQNRGPVTVQTILSSPETGSSAVQIMYYLSIVCARRSICIASPYFVPDDTSLDILIDAKQRGVDVKVMVSAKYNDNWFARHNSLRLYGTLLRAGVEIYEYNRTMLHQKTMVVDGIWATVGTTNFDNRSLALNEESNVCVYDRELGQELQNTFSSDLAVCDKIEFEVWQRRGLWIKLQGFLASFLKEQV